jgi:polysaccharide chain length determinant protein (PEP-CTERM system associated)
MQHILAMVLGRLPALWQQRWLAVSIAWIVCLIGWPIIAFVPSHYVSQTQVYVDTQNLLEPLLSGIAVDVDSTQQVDILKRTLASRSNLERVVKMTRGDTPMSDAALDRAVDALRKNLRVSSAQDKTFTISYESLVPSQAYEVVQSLLNLFVQSNVGTVRESLDNAQTFLRDQVSQYDDRMRKAQEALSNFKQTNLDLLNGGASYSDILSKTRADVQDLTAQFDDLKAQEAELQRHLDAEPKYAAAPPSASDPAPSAPVAPTEFTARIREAEQRLATLRTTYTDSYPDVVNTMRSLATLRAAEAALRQPAAPDAPAAAVPPPTSEVYQKIKLQLVDIEAQVAGIQNKLERRKAELATLERQASKMPAIDAEMQRLTREYEIARTGYEQLASRLQAANLSESRESHANKLQFRIIDPPQVPVYPSGVKRSLLLSIVLMGGVGLGLAVILILALMQNTFVDSKHLAQVTGYPVVGTVSLARDEHEESSLHAKTAAFAALFFGLFVVWGGLMLVERDSGLPSLLPSRLRQDGSAALGPMDGAPRVILVGFNLGLGKISRS